METRATKHSANTPLASGASEKLCTMTGTGKGEFNGGGVLAAMQRSLEKATEEMGQVGKLLEALGTDMTEIKEASGGLRTDVNGILTRLDEAESRISQLEDENHQVRQTADKSAKKCEELHQAVEDAANRDRHQNLRLVGQREKLEGRNSTDCVKKIISETSEIDLDGSQLQ